MKNYTTAGNLRKAIKEKLVMVDEVLLDYDEDVKDTVSADKFIHDLDNYANAGIFSNTIDFRVRQDNGKIKVDIGGKSYYCNGKISVTLSVNKGVAMEKVMDQLGKTIFDILSEQKENEYI